MIIALIVEFFLFLIFCFYTLRSTTKRKLENLWKGEGMEAWKITFCLDNKIGGCLVAMEEVRM